MCKTSRIWNARINVFSPNLSMVNYYLPIIMDFDFTWTRWSLCSFITPSNVPFDSLHSVFLGNVDFSVDQIVIVRIWSSVSYYWPVIMGDPVLAAFIARQRVLLTKEREAEIDRTSLLLSNCAPRLLEQKGLALGSLSVSSINIGLGGKTWIIFQCTTYSLLRFVEDSLVELKRPDTSPIFPSLSFRCASKRSRRSHIFTICKDLVTLRE